MLAAIGFALALLFTAGGALADQPPPPGVCDEICLPPTQCADLRDNDGDGKTDYPADPGCSGYSDNDESDTPPPGGGGNPSPQCADGRDNDADGLVDGIDPGCSSPQDNDESDDPALSTFVGAGDTQFGRVDDGVVGTDSSGAPIRCARLGAERSEHGFLAKGWSFYMTLRWCWNGTVITSWDSWNTWASSHIPFPISLIYPFDWKTVSQARPQVGAAQSSAFAQAKVQICPIKLPGCFTWYPWLRFSIDAQGHSLCESDTRRSIPDCRA